MHRKFGQYQALLVGETSSDRFNDVAIQSDSEFHSRPSALGWDEVWRSVRPLMGSFSNSSGLIELVNSEMLLLNLQSLKPFLLRISHKLVCNALASSMQSAPANKSST